MAMALSIAYHQLILLFISSFLTGLCESNMAISQSIIADRTQDTIQKTKLIGYAYAACSLGYIVGPLAGGMGGSLLSYSAPFWITAVGVMALILWIGLGFDEYVIPNKNIPIKPLQSLTAIKTLFNNPRHIKIYLINFLIFFSILGSYRMIPLYVVHEWKPTLHTYALLISFVSVVCFIANLMILGKLAKRFSTKTLLSGLLFVGSLLMCLVIFPVHFHWIWLTYGLVAIPTAMALPTCTTWLSKHATANEQGQVLGNNQALLVLGEATSAAVGGLIAAIWVPLPVIILGVILLATGVMVIRAK